MKIISTAKQNSRMKKRLVLLPGWGMHSEMWGPFAQQLASHYALTCIAQLPAEATLEAMGERILYSLDEEPFYLLGWSLGASVALHLAARYPSRVEGVILMASNPCFLANEQWPGMDATTFHAFCAQIAQNAPVTLQRFFALQCQGIEKKSEVLDTVKARFALADGPSLTALMEGLALLEKRDMREELAGITCPVAAILSCDDALIPAAVGEAMQLLQPALQLHFIEKAGHLPFVVEPEACVNILSNFVNATRKSEN